MISKRMVQNYEIIVKRERKFRKNLELSLKVFIFAVSNIQFDYAAECGE